MCRVLYNNLTTKHIVLYHKLVVLSIILCYKSCKGIIEQYCNIFTNITCYVIELITLTNKV